MDSRPLHVLSFISAFILVLVVVIVVKHNQPTKNEVDEDSEEVKQSLLDAAANKHTFDDTCQIDRTDDFVPKLTTPIRPGTIFISIASYRDDECKDTIYDMYEKASRPERVFTGVIQQNKESKEDCFDSCSKCKARKASGHIRVKNFPHTEAKGPTFARFEATKLWDGEEYFLQIDSHTKFQPGWDETVLNELEATNDPKAVLGGYPPTEEQMKQFAKNGFNKTITMCHGVMNKDGIPELRARIIDVPKGGKPIKMMYSGAGMLAMPYQALLDVPYDPYLSFLFFGEEILHSARLWTSGYNFYAPRKAFVVHHYGRGDKPKFWSDLSGFKGCQQKAVKRTKYLMGRLPLSSVDTDFRAETERFGMGKVRSLDQYYAEAGIDWEKNKFHDICKKLEKE
jgi:hypothetical protein